MLPVQHLRVDSVNVWCATGASLSPCQSLTSNQGLPALFVSINTPQDVPETQSHQQDRLLNEKGNCLLKVLTACRTALVPNFRKKSAVTFVSSFLSVPPAFFCLKFRTDFLKSKLDP